MSGPVKKILLLSPYDAMSHRCWRENLVAQFPEHDFIQIALPPRHFNWRFRGNSLTLAFDERLQDVYDLIIATSMTDLAALKGMTETIAGVPAVLYFHENQFAYPQQPAHNPLHDVERQITSLYSALAADKLIFNSNYNRTTFITGVAQLLNKMPDLVPEGINQILTERSQVAPVPIPDECYVNGQRPEKLQIVWNHRWEYDKGLKDLEEIVRGLIEAAVPLTFHVVGQRFRHVPKELERVRDQLHRAGSLGAYGFIKERSEYLKLLSSCHCVLSTALHEFQGLAVQEAMAAGCHAVVPDRLAYPEYVDPAWRYCTLEQALQLIINSSTLRDTSLPGDMRTHSNCRDSRSDSRTPNNFAGDSSVLKTPMDVPGIEQLSWQTQRPFWQSLIGAF